MSFHYFNTERKYRYNRATCASLFARIRAEYPGQTWVYAAAKEIASKNPNDWDELNESLSTMDALCHRTSREFKASFKGADLEGMIRFFLKKLRDSGFTGAVPWETEEEEEEESYSTFQERQRAYELSMGI